jgi:tRNA (mo5U34)-methyltransferase
VNVWGIIPAAGAGSRIQPLAFSKELLPVGSRMDGAVERPRAVSEFLVERLLRGGATRLCFVISPGKSDILEYYGGRVGSADVAYVMQPRPAGLCDAIFRALPLVRPDEEVAVGLPDTVWFPEDALARLDRGVLSFLLFPVQRPELFDAVLTDEHGAVREIRVKSQDAGSRWVWGAFRMPGSVLAELEALWRERGRADEYLGTLVNAWLERGGRATAVRAGESYVDVGTLNGYREAIDLLRREAPAAAAAEAPPVPGGPRGGAPRRPRYTRKEIEARVHALSPWFHNMDLDGVPTAPDHFLGDYPAVKWRQFGHAIPADLTGRSVLDVGCNAGFYSLEMKRRGAERVVAVDSDPDYLAQARFAAEVHGLEIELRQLSVYEVGSLRERFDLVLFMGVLYHLRHPLLALDLLHEHAVRDLLVFQSLQRGSDELRPLAENYPFSEREVFDDARYPKLHFVERRYAGDPTNWWIPNRACSEAMLRSAGFEVLERPEEEVYLCRRVARGAGELREPSPKAAVPAREVAP